MTAFRLPLDVRPDRYALSFDLDLERWRFSGHEQCVLVLDAPRREIVMHAVDLALTDLRARSGDRVLRPKVEPVAAHGAIRLRFDEELTPGTWSLEMRLAGAIRDDLKALYRSTRGNERYAITTLWPAESRRVFACFDESRFKARFELELVVPRGLTAIANTAVVEKRDEGDRTRWRFARTEAISPYLLAFAVGPFDGTDVVRTKSGTPVRIWVPRGLAADATYARDAQRDAIDRLERYTGIPYPYDKVEGVGVADFPAGAMENPGAVTYRLELVTAVPGKASARALKASVGVAAHELTHMWWGNLATLEWWDDLWLSESFATFVGNKIENELHPEWRIWRDFVYSAGFGFAIDALASTHAIHAEAEDAGAALQRVDAVTYQKGASVLRMLETYLGEDAFREGVRVYLRRFGGSVATASDFWQALGEVSGLDVSRIAEAWITQPGHPIVEIGTAGGRLEIAQRRFYQDPQASSQERWPIPLVLRTDRGETRVLVDDATTSVDRPAGAWLFPNARAAGFYRFALDADLRRSLLAHLADLSPEERLFLVANDWALLHAGRAHGRDHVALLRALVGEADRAVLGVALDQLFWLSANAGEGGVVAALASEIFGPVLARLGFDPRPEDDEDTRELRDHSLRALGLVARDETVRAEAAARVRAHLGGKAQSPDIIGSLAVVAATDGDAALQQAYMERVRGPDPQEGQRFRAALGFFRDDAAAAATMARIDDRTIRDQDLQGVFSWAFRNTAQRATYWRAFRDRFGGRVVPLEGMVRNALIQSTAGLTPPELAAEADTFLATIALADAAEVVARTREALRLQSAAAARIRGELATIMAGE